MVDTVDTGLPGEFILTLEELREHMNLGMQDDPMLVRLAETARGYIEGWCGPLDAFEDDMPVALVHALKMCVAHLYENRESTTFAATASELPMGFFDLIDPYRLREF